MLRVAVTGGIGSGKSTAARRLAELGAVVVDSDQLAREVVAIGTPGLAAIAERFSGAVLAPDGALNRPALAAVVFADPAALRDLNAITHPLVRRRFVELAAAAPAGSIVVNDIPLLTELSVAAQFHLVVGVGADAELRVHRLIGRGLNETDARARIANQIQDDVRRPLTDTWLTNDGAPEELVAQLDELWTRRLVPFNDNLRARVRAARGGPALSDPDPTWVTTAQRLLARVALAVGPEARSVEHIGSTAVPGLPAKDVIDLQLGVRSLAVADELAPALDAAGFVRQPGAGQDTAHPDGAAPARWTKAFHANCDPGRAVNLHVRVVGSPGWSYALLLRDWLRADDAARAEYRDLKLALVTQFAGDDSTAGYAAAKEPWFGAAWERSQEWAARTGWTPTGG